MKWDGTLTMPDLDAVDRDALERAMQIAQRDPLRKEQLQSKLEDEDGPRLQRLPPIPARSNRCR
jgi:hypothetical protein